jgi:hypothetical protein
LSNWLAGNNKGNKELLDQLEIEEWHYAKLGRPLDKDKSESDSVE